MLSGGGSSREMFKLITMRIWYRSCFYSRKTEVCCESTAVSRKASRMDVLFCYWWYCTAKATKVLRNYKQHLDIQVSASIINIMVHDEVCTGA